MHPLINLTPIPDERVRPLDLCLKALGTVRCASLLPVVACPELLVLKLWRVDTGLSKHYVPTDLFSESDGEEGFKPLAKLLACWAN